MKICPVRFKPIVMRFMAVLLILGILAVPAFLAKTSESPEQSLPSPGPLSRAHTALDGEGNCQACHLQEKKINAELCLSCHDSIAARMAGKKGVHGEVTGDCEVCHIEHGGLDVDIRPIDPKDFDHAAEAGFSLEGGHANLAGDCAQCHKSRSYLTLQSNCDFCHSDPHQGAMIQGCETCHTPAGWSQVSRAFHKVGPFPLEGKHLTVACSSCHLDGVIKGTPLTCYDCHWIRRQDDRYRTQLGSQCEKCHRPTSWTAVQWDHGVESGVPLGPTHRTLGCETCHSGQNFKNTGKTCSSCHRQDYEKTVSPNHQAAGFPIYCDLCHLPSHSSWQEARFDHGSVYPLVGIHTTLDCATCHTNNVYAGTPKDCYGCHRAAYEQARNPNHSAAGFPTTCEACHRASDASWSQARLDHNTVFPLLGVHATLNCTACHKNNIYTGTPRDCYGCHRSDYELARNPNHIAAGFPTTCEACHRASDASWNQGRFDHVWFPINSGRHAGNSCSACHKDATNYKSFTCLTCHDRGSTDSEHRGIGGYSYNSQACYSCHPQGRE